MTELKRPKAININQITFSHNYLKLPKDWQGKKATLLFVREIELEKQTMYLLDYDTEYLLDDGWNHEHYDLPDKGKYLLLLFECEGTIFTTLRKDKFMEVNGIAMTKERYFKERVGDEFELVKVDEKTSK